MSRSEDIERILVAAHALTRIAATTTRDDTPAAQWRALSVLQNEGSQRVGELAALSRTTQPGMTRLVGQLVEAGLVTRTPDPDDSRATVVTITDAGAEAIDNWRTTLGVALAPLFEDLADEDWNTLAQASRILMSRTAAPAGAAR